MRKSGLPGHLLPVAVTVLACGACTVTIEPFNISRATRDSSPVTKETRNLSPFSKIEASGTGDLEITCQQAQSVQVSTNQKSMKKVLTQVDGDTLKISLANNTSPTTLHYVITMPALTDIEVSGALNVKIGALKQDDLKLTLSGASNLSVAGEAKLVEMEASGASRLKADKLITRKCDVSLSGASVARIYASEFVKADASGASNITILGPAKEIKKTQSGASVIEVE